MAERKKLLPLVRDDYWKTLTTYNEEIKRY